jgi:predicted dehydrogenase
MASTMEPAVQNVSDSGKPLRVGVLGLGKRWQQRYRPVLRALRRRFELAAVCDPVMARAAHEARQLGCGLAAGPTELLERPDVDALLLLERSWYGLWPVEVACRLGKPVLCAVPPTGDGGHAERLRERIEQTGLPVMVALPAPFDPALLRLRELLREQLGKPRLLLGSRIVPQSNRPKEGGTQALAAGWLHLLSWCDGLLEGAPQRLLKMVSTEGVLASLLLDYGAGRAAQLSWVRAPVGRWSWRIQVCGEHGWAVAGPGRICWHSPAGRFRQSLARPGPAARVLLRAFAKALASGQPPRPSFADAHRLLHWLRLADPCFEAECLREGSAPQGRYG